MLTVSVPRSAIDYLGSVWPILTGQLRREEGINLVFQFVSRGRGATAQLSGPVGIAIKPIRFVFSIICIEQDRHDMAGTIILNCASEWLHIIESHPFGQFVIG